jgi:hypothetical protein
MLNQLRDNEGEDRGRVRQKMGGQDMWTAERCSPEQHGMRSQMNATGVRAVPEYWEGFWGSDLASGITHYGAEI